MLAATIAEGYDVFLSHRSPDKPMLERLAEKLVEETQLSPFLDRWYLIPGEPWQESLELRNEDKLARSSAPVATLSP